MRDLLVDCDGVLLNWGAGFERYVHKFGINIVDYSRYDIPGRFGVDTKFAEMLLNDFNQSEDFARLPVITGAEDVIPRLKMHGINIICVTSAVVSNRTMSLRNENLNLHFGDSISYTHYLMVDQCKRSVLSNWAGKNVMWVEDVPKNAVIGRDLGLKSILIDAPYNQGDHGVTRITGDRPWEQIYNLALQHYGL